MGQPSRIASCIEAIQKIAEPTEAAINEAACLLQWHDVGPFAAREDVPLRIRLAIVDDLIATWESDPPTPGDVDADERHLLGAWQRGLYQAREALRKEGGG